MLQWLNCIVILTLKTARWLWLLVMSDFVVAVTMQKTKSPAKLLECGWEKWATLQKV